MENPSMSLFHLGKDRFEADGREEEVTRRNFRRKEIAHTVVWALGSHMGTHSLMQQLGGLGSLACDVSVRMAPPRHIGYAGTSLGSRDTLSKFSIHPHFQTEKRHTEYDDLGDRKVHGHGHG